MAVWVDLVGVGHIPCSGCNAIVVTHRLFDSGILRPLRVESVSIWVLLAPDFTGTLSSIDLENGVVGTIDVGVNS